MFVIYFCSNKIEETGDLSVTDAAQVTHLHDFKVAEHDEVLPEAVNCSSLALHSPTVYPSGVFRRILQWPAPKTGLHAYVAMIRSYNCALNAKSDYAVHAKELGVFALARNLASTRSERWLC